MTVGPGQTNGLDTDPRGSGSDSRGTISSSRTYAYGDVATSVDHRSAESQAHLAGLLSTSELEEAFGTYRPERSASRSAVGSGDTGDFLHFEGGRPPHRFGDAGQAIWVKGGPIILAIAAVMLLFMTSWNFVMKWL